jgi:hypothetical protein
LKPVIPKVRVGDVLHGTRNLRDYLRTCSLLNYFLYLNATGAAPPGGPDSMVYTPHKKDTFTVAVNTHGKFGVWGENKDVILLFTNSSNHGLGELIHMDTSIFARWFMRTNARRPDVTKWPVHAHYLWASVQMNSQSNATRDLRLATPTRGAQEDQVFNLSKQLCYSSISRTTIRSAVRESVVQGNFRRNRRSGDLLSSKNGTVVACGPNLAEMPELRTRLKTLMKDPRTMSKARKAGGVEFFIPLPGKETP